MELFMVYGYDDNFQIIHKRITNAEDLEEIRGSKYVQSKIDSMYKKVKEDLENRKEVLFSGTPCQVAGLKYFLAKKDFENLYICDLICHGVPSQKVFNHYLEELKKKNASDIKRINFRDKTDGWSNYSVRIDFQNGKKYCKSKSEDAYMIGYRNNLFYRTACYQCQFAKQDRDSDITLGDFWGIKEKHPELFDNDKGTSLLIVNSKKGEDLIEYCKDSLQIDYKCDIKVAIETNPSIVKPASVSEKREVFFGKLETESFEKLIKEIVPKLALKSRIKVKIYKMYQKIRRNLFKR